MALLPTILWSQRNESVLLKVDIPDAKSETINLEPSGKLHFEATSNGKKYALEIALFEEVDVEKSKWVIKARTVQFYIVKKESKYWDRLLKEAGKHHFVKVDWDSWKDEDDAEEEDFDLNRNWGGDSGMDFGGDMGGMGGMGGLGGMGGMDFSKLGGLGGGPNSGPYDDDADSDKDELPDLESDKKDEHEHHGHSHDHSHGHSHDHHDHDHKHQHEEEEEEEEHKAGDP